RPVADLDVDDAPAAHRADRRRLRHGRAEHDVVRDRLLRLGTRALDLYGDALGAVEDHEVRTVAAGVALAVEVRRQLRPLRVGYAAGGAHQLDLVPVEPRDGMGPRRGDATGCPCDGEDDGCEEAGPQQAR